jgi:hypothetical protein
MSVAASLTADEAKLFWEQHPIDQRHAYSVAGRVAGMLGDHQDAFAAALLHDVGKRHSSAGPIGRSLATVADLAGVPLPPDWSRYRKHDELGAADLENIGAGPLSIAFAAGRKLPGDEIDAVVWDALRAADDA